jgi:hypothetical protein
MRGLKALLGSAALLAGVALGPAAHAQISFGINIGGPPPVCAYGYYEYSPYACAPYGFYGPGYFFNGIFLGVGPWAGWGYAHGWGSHRFIADGGGRYHGRGGYAANHGHFAHGYDDRSHGAPHGGGHPNASRGGGHPSASRGGGHPSASHGGASHGGSASHRGGASHSSGGDQHR